MNPEQLANDLDVVVPPERGKLTQADGEHPLVQTASRLANAPQPVLSADAKARIQAKMLQAMPKQQPRIIRLNYIAKWAAAVLLLMIALVGGSYPVMASSVPGDLLYPVKREVAEPIELALATTPIDEVDVHLTQAGRRLHEADVLFYEQQRFDMALIESAERSIQSANEIASAHNLNIEARVVSLSQRIDVLLENANDFDVIVVLIPSETATEVPPTATPQPVAAEPTVVVVATVVVEETETPTPPAEEPLVMMIYSSGRANVREGAGLDFDIVTTLSPGALVIVPSGDPDQQWVEIETADGILGWVAGFLLADPDTVILPSDNNTGDESTIGTSGDDNNDGSTVGSSDPGSSTEEDCTLPGSACDAPGQGNTPPGQGGVPPGQVDKTPVPPG